MTHPRSMRVTVVSALLGAGLVAAACGGTGGGGGGGEDPPFDPPAAVEVRLDTDPAGSALSTLPDVASAGARVYAVWYDRRNAMRMDVYFNRSLDDGATWLPADVRLDTDPPGAANSNVPRLCCSGDKVYVVWSDQRGGPAQVRFNRSLDAGATWLGADLRLDDVLAPGGASTEVATCCVGDVVYAVWQDTRNTEVDVYFNRSLDAGATWLPSDVLLDTSAADAQRPKVACCDASVFVVWEDERAGEADVFFRRSLDRGDSWGPEVRLDGGSAGAAASNDAVLACDGARVCVVWTDERAGARDVYANTSADAGAAWLPDAVRVETDAPGGSPSLTPSLALRGNDAFVVWADRRHGEPDVYFSRSSDGGATWLVADVRVELDSPGRSPSVGPRVAATASHLHVAWADEREGSFDVLLSSSPDQGATWRDPEVRLNTDPFGAANGLFPALAAEGATAHVAWTDDRDGEGDVYYNRGEAQD